MLPLFPFLTLISAAQVHIRETCVLHKYSSQWHSRLSVVAMVSNLFFSSPIQVLSISFFFTSCFLSCTSHFLFLMMHVLLLLFPFRISSSLSVLLGCLFWHYKFEIHWGNHGDVAALFWLFTKDAAEAHCYDFKGRPQLW